MYSLFSAPSQRKNQYGEEASDIQKRQRKLFISLGQLYRTLKNIQTVPEYLRALNISDVKYKSVADQLIIELLRQINTVEIELNLLKFSSKNNNKKIKKD